MSLNKKIFAYLSFLLLLCPLQGKASSNYYYSNGQKVYLEKNSSEELKANDEYLVSFKKDVSGDEIKEIIDKKLNSTIIESLYYVLDGKGFELKLRDSSQNVIDICNLCVEEGLCNWAHPNFTRKNYSNSIPQDQFSSLQWYLKNTTQNGGSFGADINIDKVFDITKGSENITVAVIDDGFDFDHEEFTAPGKIQKRFNLVDGNDDTRILKPGSDLNTVQNLISMNTFSHGTSVGGLIAASENGIGIVGVCPKCMLMPIKIAIDVSKGTNGVSYFTVQDKTAADAIAKATSEGADIINNSWGAPGTISDVVRLAIDFAQSNGRGGKGSIVVFSTGNGLKTSCTTSSVYAPANYPPVIAVGATDKNDKVTCYSSTGPEVDLVAPGGDPQGDIVTTDLMGIAGLSPKNTNDSFQLYTLGFNKTWQLDIFDLFSGNTGTLNNWGLEFLDINSNTYKFDSSSTSQAIPDGLGTTIASPGAPLTTTTLTQLPDILSTIPISGSPLIKDIFLNLNITHPSGFDLDSTLITPAGKLNLFRLSPSSFSMDSGFTPISKLNIFHAMNLPIFDLDKNGDYTSSFNGTSASSAIVSGVSGLILSVNPNLSYKQVEQVLKDTADKIDPSIARYKENGQSDIYGFGRVNATKAVQKALQIATVTNIGVDGTNQTTTSSSSGGTANETEPNNSISNAYSVNIPGTINGNISITDIGDTGVSFNDGSKVTLGDLFKFTIPKETSIKIILKANNSSRTSDLDLFLLNDSGTKVLDGSYTSGNSDEQIIKTLSAGTYLIGIGTFFGSASYTLSISSSQDLIIANPPAPNPTPLPNEPTTSIDTANSPLNLDGQETLVLIPSLQNHIVKLSITAKDLKAKSLCIARGSGGSRIKKVRVVPNKFFLSPIKLKKKFKVIVPRNKAIELITSNSTDTVKIQVNCSSGLSVEKDIFVKPFGLP